MLRYQDPWLEIPKPRVRVHCMSPFGVFLNKIVGLSEYAARAVVQKGTVYCGYVSETSRKNIVASHKMLKNHAGIGADELVMVQGESLTGAILNRNSGADYIEMLRRSVASGMPLEFYLTRNMEDFVAKLGIGWHQISTAMPNIAEMFDDKYRLRCLGDALNVRRAFSPWQYVQAELGAVKKARDQVLLEAHARVPTRIVYLKVHDYDGGVGVMRLDPDTPEEKLREFLDEYHGCNLVIDAGYPEDKFDTQICSMKVLFTDQGWIPFYFTKMSVKDDAHSGNTVAIGQKVLESETEMETIKATTVLNNAAYEAGYGALLPRTACIDFLRVRHEGKIHIFVLEYNARSSAADYAMSVCYEAMHRFGGGKAAVVMKNLEDLPEGMEFDELAYKYLAARPWDGGTRPGFVLANAGCLEQGKITAFTIAPEIAEAEGMMNNIVPATQVRRNPLLRVSA